MDFSSHQRLGFERRGRELRVSIYNGQMNAVDFEMHEELARLFPELQGDAESDLIVLTGAGRAFCAGGDMDWFQAMIDDPALFRAIANDAKKIVNGLLELEKPIVCRLNGAAGLGASIALLCDVIVADETAKLRDPHVKVGLVAGNGGAAIWPQLIGFARAKEMLLTGDMITGAEAAAMGLVNHTVPADRLDAKTDEIAAKILGNPRWAVRWTKTAVNLVLRDVANRVMDVAIAYEISSNAAADRQEAVTAFVEKRAPGFHRRLRRGARTCAVRSASTPLTTGPDGPAGDAHPADRRHVRGASARDVELLELPRPAAPVPGRMVAQRYGGRPALRPVLRRLYGGGPGAGRGDGPDRRPHRLFRLDDARLCGDPRLRDTSSLSGFGRMR